MQNIYLRTLSLTVLFFFVNNSEALQFYGKTSDNFIIRWGYQAHSKFVYDMITNKYQWPTAEKGKTFNPELVQSGDLVFARNIPEFMKLMHPKIKHPYILITAGEWRESVEEKWLTYLDDPKIIAWFSIHPCAGTHPKFYQLPIGIFQKPTIYENRKELNKVFTALRAQPRTGLCYSNYGDLFNKKPERKDLNDFIADKKWITQSAQIQGLEFIDYMKEMAHYKFTLSPRGYGIDCYRTWEALIVGTIPIVKTSQLDGLFKGLPVLIINEWEELTEDFLNKKYEEMVSKKYDISSLFVDYWIDKIDKIRTDFFAQKST